MTGRNTVGTNLITLEYDGPVAIISNNRPEKHNAANDEMDQGMRDILDELARNADVRSVVWRANGASWSSGRDMGELGIRTEDIDNLSFIERGQGAMKALMGLQVPVICALKGWVIGGSFERALCADLRIAAEDTRFMLPEVKHGVLTDTGGMARLFQMCGHGLTMDLILTGRVMDAEEALRHGVVSRVVSADELEETALEMARGIASSPAFTVKLARRNMALIANQMVVDSIDEEATTQTLVFASEDYAEMKAARAEEREPKYRRR
ncbi:MAG: enoyl-CoA hydratase/isomerase family protein [Deltaproteobacteria bacterium]|jgi:enoyl-CoA hydratase/carnithine racemase|nr:enoyl-CoA hydratase/isomerase family protein [Deltaproteobacteria bacterium]MBW2498992.1 enoyl-CoA hydratase/isomerase family protein [Deltaproteobacteria bacterium]